MHLTGTELFDWIALRRVHGGGVAMHGSEHLDQGRKVPCYLPEVFGRLAQPVTEPMVVRWLYLVADERSHVLDEDSARSGTVTTRCGHQLFGIVTLYSRAPSMMICPQCGLCAAVPPPKHAIYPEST